MTTHRTLDEFGEGESDAQELTPPEPTFRWEPSGAPCGSCGETVTTLWAGEYGLICRACKDW